MTPAVLQESASGWLVMIGEANEQFLKASCRSAAAKARALGATKLAFYPATRTGLKTASVQALKGRRGVVGKVSTACMKTRTA